MGDRRAMRGLQPSELAPRAGCNLELIRYCEKVPSRPSRRATQ